MEKKQNKWGKQILLKARAIWNIQVKWSHHSDCNWHMYKEHENKLWTHTHPNPSEHIWIIIHRPMLFTCHRTCWCAIAEGRDLGCWSWKQVVRLGHLLRWLHGVHQWRRGDGTKLVCNASAQVVHGVSFYISHLATIMDLLLPGSRKQPVSFLKGYRCPLLTTGCWVNHFQ